MSIVLKIFSSAKDKLMISELERLPESTINILAEVLKSYYIAMDYTRNSKFYKTYIVIISYETFVETCLVIRNPDGSLLLRKWQIENENCPAFFIRQLERAKNNENLSIEGRPAATLELSREVCDYILKKSRPGIMARLLQWFRMWTG